MSGCVTPSRCFLKKNENPRTSNSVTRNVFWKLKKEGGLIMTFHCALLLLCAVFASASTSVQGVNLHDTVEPCRAYATPYNRTACTVCRIAASNPCSVGKCPPNQHTFDVDYMITHYIYKTCRQCGNDVARANARAKNTLPLHAFEVCSPFCNFEACQHGESKSTADKTSLVKCRKAVVESCMAFAK